MGRIKLSKRLRAVYDAVGECACVCDVGCDHGQLCVQLLLDGKAQNAIAVDISAPSLEKARALAKEMGVHLRCRLGDGLQPVESHEADTVVIAGMGGMEIGHILGAVDYRPRRLVLLPHRDGEHVRKLLYVLGYAVQHDRLVADGRHYYRLLVAEALEEPRQERVEDLPYQARWYVGEDNRNNPDFAEFATERVLHLEKLIEMGNRLPSVREELRALKEFLC